MSVTLLCDNKFLIDTMRTTGENDWHYFSKDVDQSAA